MNEIMNGDALQHLRELPSESINCVMTSPPYWALRDYGSSVETIWDAKEDCEHNFEEIRTSRPNSSGGKGHLQDVNEGSFTADYKDRATYSQFCSLCGAWKGQLGLEPTFDLYIKHLCNIFNEVKRVLRKDGTCWINLGDTYSGSGNGSHDERNTERINYRGNNKLYSGQKSGKTDLQDKSICLIPFRFAIEMQNRGWILRNVIIWHKPNCMPSSVKDRFTVDFEYLYFFVKNKKYWFETQYENYTPASDVRYRQTLRAGKSYDCKEPYKDNMPYHSIKRRSNDKDGLVVGGNNLGRNKRAVWTITTKPFSEAHFACVSADTECLTIDGWKKYDEIKRGNLIASYDMQNKKIKWTPCSYLKTYNINEKIVHIGNRDLDILMTPNHRNVILKKNKEEIVLAENLAYSDKIKVSSDFEIEEHNSIGKHLAELIGWIIAEGHYQKEGGIYIYQNEGKCANRIRQLLKPFSHKEKIRRTNQVQWYIPKLTSNMFKTLCPNKKLTRDLVMIPISECQALFKGLIEGDGHKRKDDGRLCFVQKDKETTDWFSILVMRLGYHPIISVRKDKQYQVFLTKREYIGVRNTNGKGKNLEYVDYKGIVWCPKTKYGTWVARRNGRIFITGNTYPEELCETPIKAGCPEFVCNKCGKAREKIYDKKLIVDRYTNDKGKVKNVLESGDKRMVLPRARTGIDGHNEFTFKGYSSCSCNAGFSGGIVLDPFFGSGTTGLVALKLNRNFIGIELNPEYIKIAKARLRPFLEQVKLSINQLNRYSREEGE
jgi:site-specific DNA-methyltransferase (adenine-specific)